MTMGRLSKQRTAAGTASRLAIALAPRHFFYDRCNKILAEAEFDETVEMLCQPYYKDGVGRPSIPPGRYFRMLFVGQFAASSSASSSASSRALIRSARSRGAAPILSRCTASCDWWKAKWYRITRRSA